jgi:hypothetical protein
VRVHYDEGVANHIDPESCAVNREAIGEALTGERIGQAIEPRKRQHLGCRHSSVCGRQNGGARQREHPDDPAWSKNLACAYASCAGTGRSHGRPTANYVACCSGPCREGEEP